MKRLGLLLAALVLAALLLTGCFAGAWYVEEGTTRDNVTHAELRASDVSVLWLMHDETGAYCVTSDIMPYQELRDAVVAKQEMVLTYHSTRLRQGTPCYTVETSVEGSGFQTFVVTSVQILE